MAIPIGVTTKIERANHHIKNLETMIQAFHKTDPYSVVREEDPNTGALAFAIHFRSYPPATFSALIGDAVHNLRSSLDHLIGNLVLANNKRIGAGNEFPRSFRAASLTKPRRPEKCKASLPRP
jgi:hypothetical protein